jgi:hypothetical protein
VKKERITQVTEAVVELAVVEPMAENQVVLDQVTQLVLVDFLDPTLCQAEVLKATDQE